MKRKTNKKGGAAANRIGNRLRELRNDPGCSIGTECHIAMGGLRRTITEDLGYTLAPLNENINSIEGIIGLLKTALSIYPDRVLHRIFFFTSFGHYWALETKGGQYRILSNWQGTHSFDTYLGTTYGAFQPADDEFYNILRQLSSDDYDKIEDANQKLFGTMSGLSRHYAFPLTLLNSYSIR
jgi:hypothetical protein